MSGPGSNFPSVSWPHVLILLLGRLLIKKVRQVFIRAVERWAQKGKIEKAFGNKTVIIH